MSYTILDSSSKSNDGCGYRVVSDSIIKHSGTYSASFSGTNSYILVPENAFNDKTTLTIEFWFYIAEYNPEKVMFSCNGPDETIYSTIFISGTDGPPDIDYISAGYESVSGYIGLIGSEISRDEWHNVMLVIEEGVGGRLYLDGELEDENYSAPVEVPSSDIISTIGCYPGEGPTNCFIGYIDEFRVSSVARTPYELIGGVGAIDMFFEIPEDAISINQVKLSYRNEAPRIWSDTTTSGGGATSGASSISTTEDGGSSEQTSSSGGGSPVTSSSGGGVSQSSGASGGHGHELAYIKSSWPTGGFPMSKWVGSTTCDPGNHTHNITISSHTHTVNVGSHTHSVSIPSHSHGMEHTHDMSAHSHIMNYDISIKEYTTDKILIYTTDDASGVPVWVNRTNIIETALGRNLYAGENENELGLDLTDFFTDYGWKGIRVAVNGNSRHKVQVTVKCYVESK